MREGEAGHRNSNARLLFLPTPDPPETYFVSLRNFMKSFIMMLLLEVMAVKKVVAGKLG